MIRGRHAGWAPAARLQGDDHPSTHAVDDAARRAIAARTEALFRSSGALRNGHFELKSGRHSDAYLEKFQVLQDPAATSELCGFWAGCYRDDDGAATVDLVAGPTTGGVILAFETGRQLGTRAIFAEEVASPDGGPRREFRRGFTIEPGERVLLVDDILTTGGSLLAMIPAVEAAGGEIVECVVLVDRSGGLSTLTSPSTGRVYPLAALWQLELPTYEPGPGDLSGVRGRGAGGQARQQRDRRWVRGDRAAPDGVGWRREPSRSGPPPCPAPATTAAGPIGSSSRSVPASGTPAAVPASPVDGILTDIDSEGLTKVTGFQLRDGRRAGGRVQDRHARERRRVPAGAPGRAHRHVVAGAGVLPRRGDQHLVGTGSRTRPRAERSTATRNGTKPLGPPAPDHRPPRSRP